MRAKATLLGHAIHPMLVAFPLALLSLAPVFDVVFLASRNELWAQMSFWLLTCGLIGGLVAAVSGFVDFTAIPDGTRAKRVALTHMGVMLVAVVLFGISWVVRLVTGPANTVGGAFVFALLGFLVMLVGGWLGGELRERLGVSVYDDANLDAPSSLPIDGVRQRRPTEPHPV